MSKSELYKKAFVIGSRETVKGFALIGIPGKEALEEEEGIEILKQAMKDDYFLIIISASLASKIENIIDEYRKESSTPILIISDTNAKVDMKEIEKKFKLFIGF